MLLSNFEILSMNNISNFKHYFASHVIKLNRFSLCQKDATSIIIVIILRKNIQGFKRQGEVNVSN